MLKFNGELNGFIKCVKGDIIMKRKKIFGIVCTALTSLMLFSTVVTASAAEMDNKTLNGSYNIQVKGYDWGPSVNKAVVTIDKEVTEVNKDMFNVKESKNWYEGITEFERTVTGAYLSDEKGNKVQGPSKHITIEMKVSPNDGSPFIYDMKVGRNSWTSPYNLKISLKDGQVLKSGDEEITSLNISEVYTSKSLGVVDKFKETTYSKDGDISMKYAYFEPKEDNKKNPLIVWLHGAGEGGNDTTLITLGNRVGALVEDNIQNKFGGAYVLAPQSPTMWMDHTGNAEYTNDGSSIYNKSLLNLIKSYVSSNQDIDTDRIYIGGCSNGGYMTMSMILQDPEYFAAAYPICEAYSDSWITDNQINSIKNLPIWFTYAKNDKTVNPATTSEPTMDRLIKAGNTKVHKSVFDKVVDTSGLYKDENGNPYEYDGHWSWVYAFNDQCKDGNENLWSWVAKQTKAVPETDSKVDEENKQPNEENKEPSKEEVKNENTSNVKTESGEVKKDVSPKTADPLTLGMVIAGLTSGGVACKLRRRKK